MENLSETKMEAEKESTTNIRDMFKGGSVQAKRNQIDQLQYNIGPTDKDMIADLGEYKLSRNINGEFLILVTYKGGRSYFAAVSKLSHYLTMLNDDETVVSFSVQFEI